MNKEKFPKFYKKPDLNQICPPKLFQNMPSQIILSQPFKQYHELVDNDTQKSNEKLKNKKVGAATCIGWFLLSNNLQLNRNQQIKSKRQKSQKNIKEQESQRKTQSFFKRKRNSDLKSLFCKNSPYVKNKQQYQRIISSLKPVKGPTQSLMKQIKRHNQINKKNTQNVLLAGKDSFKQKIMKYSSRIGLGKDEKIFIMNSKDTHIRQTLHKHGWIECQDLSSTFFHLKWVYNDNPSDYVKLQQGQFYNHFKNNQQLTNKNLFRKNINKTILSLQPNHPQTFDLQVNEDLLKFQIEYKKYEYLNYLDRLNNFIVNDIKLKTYFDRILKISNRNLKIVFNFYIDKSFQRKFITVMQPKIFSKQQFVKCRQLRQILYAFCFILFQFQQDSHFKKNNHRRKLSFISFCNEINTVFRLLEKSLQNLGSNSYSQQQNDQIYGQHQNESDPFKNSKLRTIKPFKKQKQKIIEVEQILKQIFTHDRFLMIVIASLYRDNKIKFYNSLGINNWWIVKPAGVSRGTGIKIQCDLSKIMQSKYGKIVQKYIEKPLLLQCGRKFDIRQWVLVKSFVPLNAYVFEHCYCRFSACKYSTNNHQSLSTHLTNYSKQKSQFMKKGNLIQNSIMSEEQLCKQIDKKTWNGHWHYIKQQIKQQIVKSLKCCQYEIEDKKECFEVFGFDVILDANYKPWVLEVNMSPACEKRSEFLESYLQKMTQGIIDMIEQRPINNWTLLIDKPNYKAKNSQIIILESINKIQRFYRNRIKCKNNKPKGEKQSKSKDKNELVYEYQNNQSDQQQFGQIKNFDFLS